MKKFGAILGILGILGLSFSSCSFAPKYKKPSIALPSKKSFTLSKGNFKVSWGWWKRFKNPQLNHLIELALKNNDDLKIATAKLEEVMALAGLKKAQLFPLIGYKAQVSRTKIPEDLENSIEGFGAMLRIPIDVENPKTSYNILTSISYELDFWGKLRNARKSAIARVLAVKAMRDTIKISLVSGVVELYYNLVAINKELKTALSLETSLKDIYELKKKQSKLGLVNKIEVYQAKARYEEVKKVVEELKRLREELKSALAYLVGETPKELFEKDIKVSGDLPNDLELPSMLPSQVLLKRPDIVMAEQELRAANFDIGVAKAEYFPSITLTGYAGSLSSEFKNLMKSSTIFWSVGAGITGPIFTFGRIKAQVKFAEAKQKEALLNYIKTVKKAFKEVYTALKNIEYAKKQLKIEEERLNTLKKAWEVAKGQYENGLIDEDKVLALKSLYLQAKLDVIKTKTQLVKYYIYLYKALGGGIY